MQQLKEISKAIFDYLVAVAKDVGGAIKRYIKANKGKTIATAVLLLIILTLQILRQFSYMREYVFSRGISRTLLYYLSRFSNLFSFSITEFAVYIAIGYGVYLIVKIILSLKKVNGVRGYMKALRILHKIAIILLVIVMIFMTLFTMSYERDSAIPELNLPEVEVNAETVSFATRYFTDKTKELEVNFNIDENGVVESPYTFDELSELILLEYEQFESDFFSDFVTYPKELTFGFVNSYLGFTGYYSPFFAESNINTYQPTVSLPVTIAHELAHSKGIMRENEANFYAYFVLANSDDEYLQYCGCLVISQILLSESYDSQNTDIYYDLLDNFSYTMRIVISQKYAFWESYDTIFDDIGDWFNNLYLTSSGVSSGTKSYGETADILVRLAYMMENDGK